MSLNRGELLFISVCLAGTLAALWACAPLRAQNRLNYPAAPRGRLTEDYSGTRVADPYRWLEDLDSPATRAWVQAQAQLTRQYLDAIPELARLRSRIATLYDFEKTGIPFREGGREFYTTNSGRQDQSVLMSTQRPGAAAVVTLDPNEKFCGCGGLGHLESIMGHRAMRLRFLDMEPEEVFAASKTGENPRCSEFAILWHRALAAATASSIHMSGPGKFYISGPNARFVNVAFLNRCVQEMVKLTPLLSYVFEIVPHDNELAVIGAAVNALRAHQ